MSFYLSTASASDFVLFYIGLVTCVFSFCACVSLIRPLLDQHEKNGFVASCIPTTASGLFYFVSSIVYLLSLSHLDIRDDHNLQRDDQLVLFAMLLVFSLIMARLSLCLHFLVRVHSAFKHSIFELKRSSIAVAVTLCLCILVVITWWMALMAHRYLTGNQEFASYRVQLVVLSQLLFVSDATLSLMVVATMTHKLLQTLTLVDRTDALSRMKRLPMDMDRPQLQLQEQPTTIQEDKSLHIPAQLDEPEEPSMSTVSSNASHLSSPDVLQNSGRKHTRTLSDTVQSARDRHRKTQLELDLALNTMTKLDERTLKAITKNLLLGFLSMIPSQICYISLITASIMMANESHVNQHVLLMVLLGLLYPVEVVLRCVS